MLQKYDKRFWIGFTRALENNVTNFRDTVYKRRENCSPAQRLLASQEGLRYMTLLTPDVLYRMSEKSAHPQAPRR
jgi:hypothetical protein